MTKLRKNQNEFKHYLRIPMVVAQDNSISYGARLLYGDILLYSGNDHGYCYASNGHFAAKYGAGRSTIKRWFLELETAGHIQRETYLKAENVRERKIYPLRLIGNECYQFQNDRRDPEVVVDDIISCSKSAKQAWLLVTHTPFKDQLVPGTTSFNIVNQAIQSRWPLEK